MPQFFIDRPIFAWVVSFFILLVGILAVNNMPISQYPDVAPPAIQITATYPGASAKEVSQSVTSIIEDELNGAKGLLYYESVSDAYGQAQITVTFAPGTDPDLAQVDVQNRVSNVIAQLPSAVQQQGLKYEQTSTGFLMIVTLSSTDGSLDQTALADYTAPVGRHPVEIIVHSGRPALAVVWFKPLEALTASALHWQMARWTTQDLTGLDEDSFIGYPVDAGIGCFMDTDTQLDVSLYAQRREVRHLLRHSALAGNDTPPGVRINTVAHGLIARGTVPTLFSPTARNDTDRVAELVAWLASDRAAGITGAFYPLETTETASA